MIKKMDVITKMTASGDIIPIKIIWDDGREFVIDRVVDVRRRASTKGGGSGLRYTCSIKGQQKYLFLDENVWFVEK